MKDLFLVSRVFLRNLLRESRQRNSFFIFRFDAWSGIRTRALRLIRPHTIYTATSINQYNPYSYNYDLVRHTIYVVCINFMHEWRKLQFKNDFERQIFKKLFRDRFIYFQEFLVRNLLRESRRRIIVLYFVLMSGIGFEPWAHILLANLLPTRLRWLQVKKKNSKAMLSSTRKFIAKWMVEV